MSHVLSRTSQVIFLGFLESRFHDSNLVYGIENQHFTHCQKLRGDYMLLKGIKGIKGIKIWDMVL